MNSPQKKDFIIRWKIRLIDLIEWSLTSYNALNRILM